MEDDEKGIGYGEMGVDRGVDGGFAGMPGPERSSARGDGSRIRRSSKIAESVARAILQDISSRGLREGAMLAAEAQMLEEYDVGRASLREALRVLEIHGFIHIRPGPGGGPMVGAATSVDFGRTATMYLQKAGATMGELQEALLVVEPVLARFAAERQDPEQLAMLRENVRAAGSANLGDDLAYRDLADGFHLIFTSSSGNRVLDLFGGGLRSISIHRLTTAVFSGGRRVQIRDAHEDIAEAIFAGDSAEAERLMRLHVEAVLAHQRKRDRGLLAEVINWA